MKKAAKMRLEKQQNRDRRKDKIRRRSWAASIPRMTGEESDKRERRREIGKGKNNENGRKKKEQQQ